MLAVFNYPLKIFKLVYRQGGKTNAKEILDVVDYVSNTRMHRRMNSRICSPAKADLVVRMVDKSHVSISHAMGKRKTTAHDNIRQLMN